MEESIRCSVVFGGPVALGGDRGFTSLRTRGLFFLDFQARIRLGLTIACYFKRRCFGKISTSAFFQPKAEGLIFLLGRSGGEKTRVRLSRKDLIQLEGKVVEVLVADQVRVSVPPYDPSHGL